MEREHKMATNAHVGRHRKTSAFNPGTHRIVAGTTVPRMVAGDTLYVSLYDTVTGNALGIDFDRVAIARLRRALDQVAA